MKRFSNILYVKEPEIDNSRALAQAVVVANNNQAALTLVEVVDSVPSLKRVAAPVMPPEKIDEFLLADKREELEKLTNTITDSTVGADAKVLFGKPFIEIIREVLEHKRDLVVKPVSKHTGLGTYLFGGTDIKLLRNCPCPVWLIKATSVHGYRKVLVGLDYEPDNPENDDLNQQLLEMSASIALSNFCELHVIHAWHFEHEGFFRSSRTGLTSAEVDEIILAEENFRRTWLSKIVAKCCDTHGKEMREFLRPKLHLVQGAATHVIPELATSIDADLVVLGTLGRTGVPGVTMGNTAEKILHQLDCSVLAIKPKNFVSPVTLET